MTLHLCSLVICLSGSFGVWWCSASSFLKGADCASFSPLRVFVDPELRRVVVWSLAGETPLSPKMSLFEAPLSCSVRALTVSVSEVLVRVGEDILGLLERRTGGCGSGGAGSRLLRVLRPLLTERLAAAAHRITGLLERELEESRRKLERQRRLLEAVLSPVVRLSRSGESRPWVKVE